MIRSLLGLLVVALALLVYSNRAAHRRDVSWSSVGVSRAAALGAQDAPHEPTQLIVAPSAAVQPGGVKLGAAGPSSVSVRAEIACIPVPRTIAPPGRPTSDARLHSLPLLI